MDTVAITLELVLFCLRKTQSKYLKKVYLTLLSWSNKIGKNAHVTGSLILFISIYLVTHNYIFPLIILKIEFYATFIYLAWMKKLYFCNQK